MTFNVQVTGVTHEELVNLFSTAFYGNENMGAHYDRHELDQIPEDKREGDCFEDFLADMILNGKSIQVTDYLAEGEVYGDLPYHPAEYDDEFIVYDVTLEDILQGLSSGVNFRMMQEIQSGEGDMFTAYGLMQRIVFGEEIYG